MIIFSLLKKNPKTKKLDFSEAFHTIDHFLLKLQPPLVPVFSIPPSFSFGHSFPSLLSVFFLSLNYAKLFLFSPPFWFLAHESLTIHPRYLEHHLEPFTSFTTLTSCLMNHHAWFLLLSMYLMSLSIYTLWFCFSSVQMTTSSSLPQ